MRRALRALSTVLIVAGALLLADAALTLLWQEPVSAVYGRIQQDQLEGQLKDLEKAPIAACSTRANAVSVCVAASARTDCSGSVAASAVIVPISTIAAITT